MTDTEFSRLFSDLATTAQKLNQRSDAISALIERFEQSLNALNVGVEVWLTLDSSPLGEDVGPGTDDVELGYVKVADAWRLAVRAVTYDSNGEALEEGAPALLLNASRKHRIRALELFPSLVRDLKSAADQAIATIDRAEALAK